MFRNLFIPKFAKISYSQCGEDLIISHIIKSLSIQTPTYIDVGAHHPFYLSNTAYFYNGGCKGINIEPDPLLFTHILKKRPKDTNLNIGIGAFNGELDFYLMSTPTLNTFSYENAMTLQVEHGVRIKEIKKIPVETLANVINKYNENRFPDFLSLDTEGYDLDILKTIDYLTNAPVVICVETISYSTTGRGVKDDEIIQFLKERNYLVYADTNINTILVKRSCWER